MAENIRGMSSLMARFQAIGANDKLMRRLALSAIREQKIMAPKKTGNLRRSILLGAVTDRYAETKATANYSAAVELGTRPHIIRPKNKKALSWKTGSNRIQVGGFAFSASAGASSQIAGVSTGAARPGRRRAFAKFVRHPGTSPQPFMVPGAKKAIADNGVQDIVKAWNEAA